MNELFEYCRFLNLSRFTQLYKISSHLKFVWGCIFIFKDKKIIEEVWLSLSSTILFYFEAFRFISQSTCNILLYDQNKINHLASNYYQQ